MDTDVEPEKLRQRHRRRLIGAILIAGVAIVAVPWLMGQSRQPKQVPSAAVVGTVVPRPLTPTQAPPPSPVTTNTTLEAVELPPEPPAKTTPPEPPPGPKPVPPQVAGQIQVQVGVFAHHDGVLMLDKKLRKMGFIPQIELLTVAGGAQRWRVRIGPFATSTDSNNALKRLATLGIKAIRVP